MSPREDPVVDTSQRREATDDMDALLRALPPEVGDRIRGSARGSDVIEVVMDLGRPPEARFGGGGEEMLLEREVDEDDIQYVVDHIGSFGQDNRAGIERTLHRISAIRNRNGKIVGLTCRIGRAVFGTIEIVKDLVESGRSILIMGRPGIGKTTMLREAARVLADDLDKRVVVVDTSNEIAGDGDIPHPGIGRARRMQVRTPDLQHAVMIEAVENHMPEVIVIDEIGTELEAVAARTIAERGVQLIGTAHGNNLDNLMLNPTLSDLIGGIQTVTLGDEEARRRRTQKSVLERKAPPTFDVVVEIQDRDRVTVHADVAETVDALLRGDPVAPELRWRDEGGVHRTQARPRPGPAAQIPGERFGGLVGAGMPGWRVEPGWRPESRRSEALPRGADPGLRPGFRPGGGGGWRARSPARGRSEPSADRWETGSGHPGGEPERRATAPAFVAGPLADRGPLERGTPVVEPRARDARELERQAEWRASASRAMRELEGLESLPGSGGPPAGVGAMGAVAEGGLAGGPRGAVAAAGSTLPDAETEDGSSWEVEADDADTGVIRLGDGHDEAPLRLPTLRVFGFGISRKRLEQAIRELQLPVIVARDADEADVVLTLRAYYKQKAPALREAEERGLPIFVLKTNTSTQIEASLTSLYAMDLDPREAALREVEEAIGLVRSEARPVELSPQNAFVRRLQHQAAEAANLVSRSRGREPYRRVRVYPEKVRSWR
jgi:stage III sporulation protein SpoIIIAA